MTKLPQNSRHLGLSLMLSLTILILFVLFSVPAWGTPAQRVGNDPLQDVTTISILPSDDTYVWHFQPNSAFGHEQTFWVYPDDGIPLLKFPLSDIPPGAEIISATLTLTMPPGAYPWGSGDGAAIQMLSSADWDEDSVTWNNAPGIDPNAPEAEATLNPYSAWSADAWDVTELVRYALASPSLTTRVYDDITSTVTATLPIRIFPKQGNWYDSHEWRSKENNDSSAPQLNVAYRAATPTPTPTPATPILTMGGGGDPQNRCPDGKEWTVQRVSIAVNEVTDWQVSRIAFVASGAGNEARDIKEARLYKGDQFLGKAAYNADNGTIAFDVNIHIPAGSGISLELRYVLDLDKLEWDNDQNKLAKTYRTTTGVQRLSATPLNWEGEYEKLPPAPLQGPLQQVARVWNTSLNPWQGYGVIQAGVDAATTQDGHTLDLCPDIFTENVQVTKALTIRAKERASGAARAWQSGDVVVQAKDANQPVFTLTRDNTTLQGLTIRGATGNEAAGVLAEGPGPGRVLRGIGLHDNTIHANYDGVIFRYVDESVVQNNQIRDSSHYGLYLGPGDGDEETFVTVEGNVITNSGAVGVMAEGSSATAQVLQNRIQDNVVGILLKGADHMLVEQNTLDSNDVIIEEGNDNRLNNNTITRAGDYGIHLRRTSFTTLRGNTIIDANEVGVGLDHAIGTTIEDCRIEMTLVAPNKHLVDIRDGSSGTVLKGCSLETRDATYIGVYMEQSSDLKVQDTEIQGGKYGIYLKDASVVTLNGGEIREQKVEGVHCEDSRTIKAGPKTTQFTNAGERALAFYRCAALEGYRSPLSQLAIAGASTKAGVYFEESARFDVTGSTFEGVGGPGVVITATQSINVNGATFRNLPVGVSASQAQDITVGDSAFRNVTETAVRAENVQNLRLEKNTVEKGTDSALQAASTSLADGFHLTRARNSQVSNNTVKGLSGQGLIVAESQDVTVQNNTFQNLGGRGVLVSEGQNVTVATNTITDNRGSGVVVWKGQSHRVETNLIHSNQGAGVALYESTQSAISKNEIHNTARQGAQFRAQAASPTVPYEEEGHGILVVRGKENRLDENVVRNSAGHGVLLGCYTTQVMDHRTCSGTTLLKNDIANNAGDGVRVSWAEYARIQGHIVENNGGYGILLSNSAFTRISDADDDTRTQVTGNRIGVAILGGHHNDIYNAQISNPQEHGILLRDTTMNAVESNQISNPGRDGIRFENAPDNTQGESSNTSLNQITNPGQYGIYLSRSPENELVVNTIRDSKLEGIYLTRSDNTVLDTNRVYHSGQHGILIERTNGATLKDNTVQQAQGHGIMLRLGAQKNLLEGNQVGDYQDNAGNQGDGIHLAYAHENVLRKNHVVENRGHGIFLSISHGNVLQENELMANFGDGIHTEGSIRLQVLKNVVEDNRGDAIALVNTHVSSWPKGAMVRGNRLNRTKLAEGGKNGVYIDNANYIKVWDNRITNFPESAVHLANTRDVNVSWNTMLNNCDGITLVNTILGSGSVAYNTIRNSWCLFTGIHLDNASGEIVGNEIRGGAGDGIVADNGSTPTLRRNTIVDNGRDGVRAMNGSQPLLRENTLSGNGGLGVNNQDASVTVDAQRNWWGDASGPGGQGPGLGDGVSAGVDYGDWLNEPAGLSLSVTPSDLPVLPDSQAVVWVNVQSLRELPMNVTVTVGDDLGWTPPGYQFTTTLTQTVGANLPITLTVPADAAAGAVNRVHLSAQGGGMSATALFTATVLAPVEGLTIQGPTTVLAGQPVTYTAMITPATVSEITYLWSPEPDAGQGTDTARMVWEEPGLYRLVVEVDQLGRVTRAEKQVAVWGQRRIYLPVVVR